MKLSEAIIKGCEGTYQIEGEYEDGNGGYCAFGAAARSLKISASQVNGSTFPFLTTEYPHPETGDGQSVEQIILNLNDTHKWPRLSIAEWLANVVEPELEK